MKWISLATLLLISNICWGEHFTREGKFYLPGKVSGTPLFTQILEIEVNPEHEQTTRSHISDADGKIVMNETSKAIDGRIMEQHIEQLQIGEVYEFKREGHNGSFKKWKIDKDKQLLVEEKTEELREPFITGPVTENFLRTKITELDNKQKILVHFGVFEFSKSIDFQFESIGQKEDKNLKIRMRIANFLLRLLVDPIVLEIDRKDNNLVHFTGRTPLRLQKEGKWQPFDAEILYETHRDPGP